MSGSVNKPAVVSSAAKVLLRPIGANVASFAAVLLYLTLLVRRVPQVRCSVAVQIFPVAARKVAGVPEQRIIKAFILFRNVFVAVGGGGGGGSVNMKIARILRQYRCAWLAGRRRRRVRCCPRRCC